MKRALGTRLIKEPFFWFALIAILLFLADDWYETDPIRVDNQTLARISQLWQTQMGELPSETELQSLAENWIREETFYREALRIGLGDDDTIVRRRLVQKYQFLIESKNEPDIDGEDIARFYQANLARYSLPKRLTFAQILLKDGQSAEVAMAELRQGRQWRTVGAADSLLPKRQQNQTIQTIDHEFGPHFHTQLDLSLVDRWQGPVASSYGRHLVRIEAVLPAGAIALAEIKDKVRYDLSSDIARRNINEAAKKLRRRYPVIYE